MCFSGLTLILRQLASVAAWVLFRYQFPSNLVRELERWLEELADELDAQAISRGPLHREIMEITRLSALRCIPDGSYLAKCQNAMARIE